MHIPLDRVASDNQVELFKQLAWSLYIHKQLEFANKEMRMSLGIVQAYAPIIKNEVAK